MRYRPLLCVLLGLAAALAAPKEPVLLRFVLWDGDESSKIIKQEVANFEKAHPGIKVKYERADYNNYFEKLLTQYAADVAPDVAMMDPGNFQRYARRGAFLELNPFMEATPGFDLKSYYPSIVDAHSLDGKLYVLPRDIAPIALLYYNKKLFDEAGLPYPDGNWTWDWKVRPELKEKDFLWVLQKLSKTDARGKPVQWGVVPGWQGWMTDLFYMSQGARLVDDPKDPTKILYDDPRVVKAFQHYADLTLKQKWIPSSFDQAGTNARQMFTQGRVAMFMSGIWESTQLRTEIPLPEKGGFDWDIALAPAYKDGTRAYPTGGSGYAIMSRTRHPKEAWELTRWMAGEPGMMAMAKAGLAQPAIKRLALMHPWIPQPNTPNGVDMPHNRVITDTAEKYVVFPPTGILFNEVNGIAQQPHSLVFTGDSTAEKELPKGNKIAQQRLDTLRAELNLGPYNWTAGVGIGLAIALSILGWVYGPEVGRRLTRRQKREAWAAYGFILPWVVGMVVFTTGPMILSLLMSFSDWDIIRPARWRGAGNYVEAFAVDPTFWKSLQVTLTYTILSVPLGLGVSLALALLLNLKVRGIALWRTCYYIPSIASPIAGSLIWLKLLQPDGGLFNALIFGSDGKGFIPGLATVMGPLAGSNGQINWLQNERTALPSLIFMSIFGAGGGMLILLAGLQGVPTMYYEAATLDGASPLQRFRNVTIPLISPALFFCLITGFIGTFQVFTQAYQMTQGGPNNATMFFMYFLYNSAFRTLRMGYASALAWVLFFVILVFTIIQLQGNRYVHYEGDR